MQEKKSHRIYFGWWINLVTGVITGIAEVYTYQGASVLFKPIATDLGLDRAATSVATGAGILLNGFVFAFAGWLADRFGPRWVVLCGAVLMGSGAILMSTVSAAWSYYIIWALLIVSGSTLAFSVAIDTMLANWFIRKRGLAFSIRFGLVGMIGVLLLPLLSWLIVTLGWRTTSIIWGGTLLASIPLLMHYVRPRKPEFYGLLPDGASPLLPAQTDPESILNIGKRYASDTHETDYSLKQALKTSAYWMINLGWVANSVVHAGFNLHIVPWLTDKGITPVAAGSMLALMIFITIPASVFGGLLANRVNKAHIKFLLVGALALQSGGIVSFLLSPNLAGIYILLIFYGLGLGTYTPVDILIRARYFGRTAYGSIQGLAMLMSAPLAFMAPVFTGWVFDNTGAYTIAFITLAALAGAGALVISCARPPAELSP